MVAAAGVGSYTGRYSQAGPGPGALRSIRPASILVDSCSLPGETRADDVVISDGDIIPLSSNRWFVIYHTRGYRGVDDERSVIYQVRRDAPDGTVLKEGLLERARADWMPEGFDPAVLEPGQTLFKQHGHTVAWGVPKGAESGGGLVHSNHFAAMWRVTARILEPDRDALLHSSVGPARTSITQGVEWIQFRLNAAGDDIEITSPVQRLRQRGFESAGAVFCQREDARWMNQSFVRPVPLNAEKTEFAVCNHFDGQRVAALRFRFEDGAWHWVETGPFLSPHGWEASLAPWRGDWIICTRPRGARGVAWTRTSDPFQEMPVPTVVKSPASNAPRTLYQCADGQLRLFTGDADQSPYRNGRDPLYGWNIDPDNGFRADNRQVIFDSVATGLPIRKESWPKVDFPKLIAPHGSEQLLTFRVCTRNYNFPYVGRSGKPNGIPPIEAAEKRATAWYAAKLQFAR